MNRLQQRICWITTIVMLTIMSSTLAQTQKGSNLIGVQVGTISLSKRSNVGSTVTLKPAYGKFIANNLLIGAELPFYYFDGGVDPFFYKSTQLGVAPFIRYYIGSSALKPYLGAFGGLRYTHSKEFNAITTLDETRTNAFLYGATVGLAYFINKSVSFDITANYTETNNMQDYTLDAREYGISYGIPKAFTINLGFQIYLGKGKM